MQNHSRSVHVCKKKRMTNGTSKCSVFCLTLKFYFSVVFFIHSLSEPECMMVNSDDLHTHIPSYETTGSP